MGDDVNLLDEICDDPDDDGSDYGRGFAAGVAAGRRQAADALRQAADSTRETYLRDAFTLAARIAEAAPAEPVEEDTRWTDAQEAEYQRLDSLSLECQQRVCSGCDGLKWGPGNTPCAHECHSTEEGPDD